MLRLSTILGQLIFNFGGSALDKQGSIEFVPDFPLRKRSFEVKMFFAHDSFETGNDYSVSKVKPLHAITQWPPFFTNLGHALMSLGIICVFRWIFRLRYSCCSGRSQQSD